MNLIQWKELTSDPQAVKAIPFTYGKFISNYKDDDLDEKLTQIIRCILHIISDEYTQALKHNETTSVSNYFKTDAKYYKNILKSIADYLPLSLGKDIKTSMNIFKRIE